MARGLAEAGARVVLNGRDPGKLEAAAATLRAAGLTVETAAFDVTDSAAVRRRHPRPGRARRRPSTSSSTTPACSTAAPIEEFSDADWRRLMATNLDAPFFLARAVVPAMKARRAGKIINIGSLMSRLARPTTVPYQVSKGGIAMLTRGLAVELAPHDIQVNAIAPGFFRTEMNAALTGNPEFSAWVEKRTPAGRWADAGGAGGGGGVPRLARLDAS